MKTELYNAIKLKPISLSNAGRLFNLIDENRAYLAEWMPWALTTTKITDTTQFIKDSQKKMKERKLFLTEIWYDDKIVGIIDLHQIDSRNRKAQVGYWLSRDYQGKGIMTKAVKSIINYGFTEFQLKRIEILINESNKKSIAVPERLGLLKEGLLRNFTINKGISIHYYIYSIIREEWQNI